MNEEININNCNSNELSDISRREFEEQILSKGFDVSQLDNERTLISLASEILDGLNKISCDIIEISYKIMGKDADSVAFVKEPTIDSKNITRILNTAIRTMRRVNSSVLNIKDKL